MTKRIGFATLSFLFALASAYAQTTDFLELVKDGTPQDVQAAISKGADVNAPMGFEYIYTPLIYAARYNPNPEVLTTLLKAGADLEARDRSQGGTALMWAAEDNENPEVITTLLKAGADLEARSKDGMTALMSAAAYNQTPEVITMLLDAGADAKVKDGRGRTAFDYAQTRSKPKDTDAYRRLQEASQ